MKLSKFSPASSVEVALQPEAESVVEQARLQAENLFDTKALLCAEAVLVSLNDTFDGPLTDEEAINLGSTFCMGVGNAGCMCGALAGGLAAVGLFSAKGTLASSNAHSRNLGKELHDVFVKRHGSSCCRVLTRRVKKDPKQHFVQCTMLTGDATQLAARMIAAERMRHGRQILKNDGPVRLSRTGVMLQRAVSLIRDGLQKVVNVLH